MAKKIVRKLLNRNKEKSHNATPTQSQGPTPARSRVATPTPDARQEHQGTGAIVDILNTVLKVAKEVSVTFPPLQAAIAGVCECIDIYKV